jgi:hypothetical protein
MKTGVHSFLRRSLALAVAGILIVVLTACTGRGGGYLPPDGVVFTGPASFGFDFSCERSSRSTSTNPPTGQLRIQLAYTDHGSNPIGSSFSIHGIVDTIDPVLESAICIGREPPPGGNELIFLGRYRLLAGAPTGFPTTCPTRETRTTPLCRFEVIVRDNDGNLAPSTGDFFSIKLSSATAVTSELPLVFYARAGFLAGGNLTVR